LIFRGGEEPLTLESRVTKLEKGHVSSQTTVVRNKTKTSGRGGDTFSSHEVWSSKDGGARRSSQMSNQRQVSTSIGRSAKGFSRRGSRWLGGTDNRRLRKNCLEQLCPRSLRGGDGPGTRRGESLIGLKKESGRDVSMQGSSTRRGNLRMSKIGSRGLGLVITDVERVGLPSRCPKGEPRGGSCRLG